MITILLLYCENHVIFFMYCTSADIHFPISPYQVIDFSFCQLRITLHRYWTSLRHRKSGMQKLYRPLLDSVLRCPPWSYFSGHAPDFSTSSSWQSGSKRSRTPLIFRPGSYCKTRPQRCWTTLRLGAEDNGNHFLYYNKILSNQGRQYSFIQPWWWVIIDLSSASNLSITKAKRVNVCLLKFLHWSDRKWKVVYLQCPAYSSDYIISILKTVFDKNYKAFPQ